MVGSDNGCMPTGEESSFVGTCGPVQSPKMGRPPSKTSSQTSKKEYFYSVLRKFNASAPKSYHRISFEVCSLVFGPEFPDKAFQSLPALREWYRAILLCWLRDSLSAIDMWRNRLPTQDNE